MTHEFSTKSIRLAICILFAVIIVSGCAYIISAVFTSYRNVGKEKMMVKDYPYFSEMDSLLKESVLDERKLLIELWNNQKHLNSMRSDIIADSRQETYNSLDKMMSQLNFWIAVLALLGVFVPIALTHKGEKDFKERMASKEEAQDKRLRLYFDDVNFRLTEKESHFSVMRDEFNDWKTKFNALREDMDLEMSLSSLASIRNNRILETTPDLRKAYVILAIHPIRQTLRILRNKLGNGRVLIDQGEKWEVIKMIFQIYEIIRNMTYEHSGHSRPRYLYQGEETIKKLIKELISDLPSKHTVDTLFEDLCRNLKVIVDRIHNSESFPG